MEQAEARTGDSSSAVKARLRKALPHTLVISPESLSLMMTHGDFREKVAGLRCVIVDEWHELLGNKRGVQTELCLVIQIRVIFCADYCVDLLFDQIN